MEFETVIRKRTATRKFKNEQITNEQLNKILEAGRQAPTAKNIQPQKIYVIQSKEAITKIDQSTPCRYNAPTVLLVCSDKSKAFSKNNHSTYEIDASIVATHMMLEATNIGVDNIWIELFDKNKIKEDFNLPKELEPICLIPLGYKADDCLENPLHQIRKDLDETTEFL